MRLRLKDIPVIDFWFGQSLDIHMREFITLVTARVVFQTA